MAGRQQRRVFVPGPPARRHLLLQGLEEHHRQRRRELLFPHRHQYSEAQKLLLVKIINAYRQDLFIFRRSRVDIQRREQVWKRCHGFVVQMGILAQDVDESLPRKVPRDHWQYLRKTWTVWKSRAVEKRQRLRQKGLEGQLSQLEVNICAIDDFIVRNNPNHPVRNVNVQHGNEDEVTDEEEIEEGGGVLTEEFQRALFTIGQDNDDEDA